MFRFNLPGLVMFLIGGAIGFGSKALFNLGMVDVEFMILGFVMLILDSVYRVRISSAEGRAQWFDVKAGGFFILHAWIVGAVAAFYPLISPYLPA